MGEENDIGKIKTTITNPLKIGDEKNKISWANRCVTCLFTTITFLLSALTPIWFFFCKSANGIVIVTMWIVHEKNMIHCPIYDLSVEIVSKYKQWEWKKMYKSFQLLDKSEWRLWFIFLNGFKHYQTTNIWSSVANAIPCNIRFLIHGNDKFIHKNISMVGLVIIGNELWSIR